MTKYCIIICGGGGKTTLYENYSDKFLDIDYFIKENNKNICNCFSNDKIDIQMIGNIYQSEMKNNLKLRNDKRILLVHRRNNTILLDREILLIAKPSKNLHENNISSRKEPFKNLARNDWLNIEGHDVFIYNNFEELYDKIFSIL